MYKHLVIDTEYNKLLCSPTLVGNGEIAEIYSIDGETPAQAGGRLLKKIGDPGRFETVEPADGSIRSYELGEKCVLRVLYKNASGSRRRRFNKEEKAIISIERGETFREKKVCKAKTGSVRKRKN